MILCEFNYCIYNKKSECMLISISISPLGLCEDCLLPNIKDDTLDKYKKETLKCLERKKHLGKNSHIVEKG